MDDRKHLDEAEQPRLTSVDAGGHTLPASEADDGAGEEGERGPEPFSGTMLPPD